MACRAGQAGGARTCRTCAPPFTPLPVAYVQPTPHHDRPSGCAPPSLPSARRRQPAPWLPWLLAAGLRRAGRPISRRSHAPHARSALLLLLAVAAAALLSHRGWCCRPNARANSTAAMKCPTARHEHQRA